MKRVIVLAALVVLGGISVMALQGPNVAEIQKVKDNLYMITGGGGNTAAFLTDAGVVVVDTKLAGWGQPILDKIKTVSNKPVVMIINTHSHPDHVGSNEAFIDGCVVDEVVGRTGKRLRFSKLHLPNTLDPETIAQDPAP